MFKRKSNKFRASIASHEPKKHWWKFHSVWWWLKRFCTVLGALVLVYMVFAVWAFSQLLSETAAPLPDEMVLYLNFDDGVGENVPDVSFSEPFAPASMSVHEMVRAVNKATHDPAVHGIFAKMDDGYFSMAHVQELRSSLKRFQEESGKFAYIYSTSYGAAGAGLGRYYLASVFEEIWMQPLGLVSISGINADVPYLRGVLDKIGVSPQFYQRKEFKTAYESMSRTKMSPENREAMSVLINDIKTEIVRDVSDDMGVLPGAFAKMVDQGLFTSQEAEKAGLVDYIGYVDEIVGIINELLTGDVDDESIPFVHAQDYLHNEEVQSGGFAELIMQDQYLSGMPKIALVSAVGAIMPGRGQALLAPSVVGGQKIASAKEIVPAILDAIDDPDVEAIVLRIDSPGGSPAASESILHALERAQAKDIPVIVSMGPVAASGGYWIAASADQIFVSPSTITGSIGVVGGKIYLKDMWEKIGVNWDGVSWGENSNMWSMNSGFSKSAEKRVNAMLDHVYDSFIARVAKGRKMSISHVDTLARGRVWSGRKAVQHGLADQIGGLDDALRYTANYIGYDYQDVDVEQFPRPRSTFEQFIELMGGQVALGQSLKLQSNILQMLYPAIEQVQMNARPDLYSVYSPIKLH